MESPTEGGIRRACRAVWKRVLRLCTPLTRSSIEKVVGSMESALVGKEGRGVGKVLGDVQGGLGGGAEKGGAGLGPNKKECVKWPNPPRWSIVKGRSEKSLALRSAMSRAASTWDVRPMNFLRMLWSCAA